MYLDSKKLPFRKHINKWRPVTVPDEVFWLENETVKIIEPQAIRILVCGNTGVGKSTLINKVFGVEVVSSELLQPYVLMSSLIWACQTKASARSRGVHNIKDPMTSPNRPDLIVHDSGGFETGGTDELQRVKDFVTDLSNKADHNDRLHVIWSVTSLSFDFKWRK